MWKIDKTFHFEYGHRVRNQTLNSEFSVDSKTCCRHLHGHSGKIKVFLSDTKLNEQSMVTDFKHLNWFKNFVDDIVDHKFIWDLNDPILYKIINPLFDSNIPEYVPVTVPGTEMIAGYKLNIESLPETCPQYEVAEGMLLVDFIPTSENLAKWFFEITSIKMSQLGVKVTRVDLWETPKSRSSYYGSQRYA